MLDDVILEMSASNKGQIGGVGSGGEEPTLAEKIWQHGAKLGNS